MKKFFPGPLGDHARNLMRRMGYGEHVGHGEQLSYVRRVGSSLFPRYHAYVENRDGGLQVNLHVDQKKASYHGSSAHAGEYEGPLVEEEMHRIESLVKLPPAPPSPTAATQSKKGFWGTIFG